MSGNVFEQYQKYFESIISRHKTICHLENQNHEVQQQQQPTPQPVTQSQPPTTQTSQPVSQPQQQPVTQPQLQPTTQPLQPLLQDSIAQDIPWQQMPQAANYAYWPRHGANMYGPVFPPAVPMQPVYRRASQPIEYFPPAYRQGYNTFPDCSYYARVNPYQQFPQPFYPQQPFARYPQYNSGFGVRPQPATDTAATVAPPPQMQQAPVAADTAFAPDGPAEVAVTADPSNKKQTFCYPSSVNGFQGTVPCGPCTSCKAPQPAPASAAIEQQQGQPCEGGKDCTGWSSAEGSGTRDRLPLGVEEPFVVGPTTYQYFFDHPA